MKKSNGTVLSIYSLIISIIVLITNIIITIQGFNKNSGLIIIVAFVLDIVTSIISIIGLVNANKKGKTCAIISLFIAIMCIIYEVFLIFNASYPI